MGATVYSGTIVFLIDQSRVEVDISYVPSLASLETFAIYIHQYTTAKVESVTLHTTKYLDGLDESLGDYHDLDLKGVIGLKNHTPDVDEYPYRQFHLPAPKGGMFELIANVGLRVKTTDGDNIASEYANLTGKDYHFTRGALIGG